jgi:CubicO group peptidase (beta-lactamase class C family)
MTKMTTMKMTTMATKHLGASAALLGLLALLTANTPAVAQQGPEPWRQVADVAAAGWSADSLEEARRYASEIGTTAALVIERGRVIAAWGDVTTPHNVFSIRKSLLGALYGIGVERGEIDLSATLADLEIDDEPPLTERERTARVVDLLRARSGVYHTAAFETSGMIEYRPERDSHEPGRHWFYNNWDFNTLATIHRELTGEEVFPAFAERLARPLGMQDFRLDAHTRYRIEPEKSIHPAYLFFLSARDLARFGQLWLQEGRWGEEQLVPAAWMRASLTSYSEAFDGGYGYMSWWTYPASFAAEYGYEQLRNYDSYMTTGSGGQALWIVPDLELVFVHLHERVNDSAVGSPEYWTLLDRIVAARVGTAYRGSGASMAPAADPPLTDVRPQPLGSARPIGAEIMEGRMRQ